MNRKLAMTTALSLFLTLPTEAKSSQVNVGLLIQHPIAPGSSTQPSTYFGVSTYSFLNSTLVLAMNRKDCAAFLAAYKKLDYSLNRVTKGTRCKAVNVLEVPRFFIPNLLATDR
ncbi:hypothetical protein [Massilia timonae]|uniref:Uncharacterized protein n=1 Tax=Massilia timonae TaxID=47229 RepID=A0A1S2NFK4_9BURK|nr:hypothetical protein [Massilia timonae]OIJ43857.1 hypothetical protein LO55_1270 [Massilia timonae]